ncbi:allophanate hydrolase subunit 1 [uncultured Methylovirgula sp.]|uniref:5-oxoprolinase subunit B family protein n=1 Tax=uncultured Methylovirgula sp. TaxID=1285960 RepID=UPI0026033545|nr:allophanate hydrolase subunit 1 [uncultured Methylovirgula sp.]
MPTAPRFLPAGESALVVEFGAAIDAALNDKVHAFDRALAQAAIPGIIEAVPTYRSLMIHFDPRVLATDALIARLRRLEMAPEAVAPARHWLIPACYEPPHAEDLAEVSAALNLAPERVVALHAGATYRIYMFGFAPGYVFLGGLPPELAISRRPKPRPPVPQGALLIAGGQALIANRPMPTGWYNLGATPALLFDPRRMPPVAVDLGDRISFVPVDGATFATLRQAAADGAPAIRQKA